MFFLSCWCVFCLFCFGCPFCLMAFIYTLIHRHIARVRAPSTHTHAFYMPRRVWNAHTHTHINFGVFIFMYSYVLLSAVRRRRWWMVWVGFSVGWGGCELAAFVHNANVRVRISGWTDFSATGVTTGRTHARTHRQQSQREEKKTLKHST